MKNNKRWLSLLLVFVMMLSVMPLNVFAAATDTTKNNAEAQMRDEPVGRNLVVTGGTSDVTSPVMPNATVKVTAGTAPTGEVFEKWESSVSINANLTDNPLTFKMPDSDITLTAKFTPEAKKVTVVNGISDKATAKKDEIVTITADEPAVGKKFVNWTADENVTITNASASKTTFKMGDKAVIITAHYEDKVVLDTAALELKITEAKTKVTETSKYTPESINLLKAAITVAENVKTTATTQTQINNATKALDDVIKALVEQTPVTEYVEVNFYQNGGNGLDRTIKVKKGSTVTKPANPTRSGYTFKGWTEVKNGSTIFDFNTNINSDMDLYAKWESNSTGKYTVSYNRNGGSGAVPTDSKTYANGDYATVKSRGDLYRTGYTFDGWTTNSSGSGTYYYSGDEIKITGNTNLYAQWRKTSDSSNNNYDKRVYPTGIKVYDSGYRVEGRLSDYKNTKIYVEYDGSQVASGYTDSNGYFDFKTDRYIKDNSDLKFYTNSSTSSSTNKRVYPNSIDVYDGGYRVKGRLSDYKNTRVYVEYDGKSVGDGMTDSSGYFDIKTDRKIYDDSYLKFYVRTSSSDKTKAATITSAKAGEYKIEGTAAAYATVTVKDKDNVKLGSATADKDGKFTIYANRTLKSGEKLTITTSESGKSDNSITYTVSESKTADLKRISYIKGYPNGNFKPHGNITRGEAATMFARLLNNSDNFGTTKTTKFTDANNQWYSEAINYVVNKGLISGYPDGTFKPNANITRAEFAQMISGYVTVGGSATNFKDVNDHWAKEAIEKLYGNKSVTGYPDGTFKPNDEITRAEAVTILNSVFGRVSNTQSFDSVKSSLKSFGDVKSSDWFYANVMDASNAHDSYRKSSTDDTEVWTKIN
ncbi:Listeria/Bacterioides repeat-containing protein [Anaerosphaera aminiphila DSM 21120]|uniref:Listeria/Bacterioides repeat-containing protein n=1 Tax=Anaerosphaera aminiphila DSM 21120 TaxID=1120995 RepID=A0A1M5QCT4_9FIRM|nr:S-layer homology domain-containing protein [Anaerosphaera aminiphila]SHH11666.1 Listeria/Bacterioides repeat-containing protein [Anaerosphaera aminiphila DSM 21120]